MSIRALIIPLLVCGLSGCGQSLHDLVARDDAPAVRAMLAARPASVHSLNENRKTPLHYAVSFKCMDLLPVLVDAGADVNAKDITGMTPLHVAAMLGRHDEAQWLLDHGAQLEPTDAFGDTPVHTAAIFGGGGVIQVLHDRGAPLDTKNNAGLTPLDLAKKFHQDKVAGFLERLLGLES